MGARTKTGWTLVETLVGLSILTMLLLGLTVTQTTLGRMNDRQMVKQRCLAAAESQLDSLAATGRAIPQAEVERLWPGLRLRAERSEGAGDWTGLVLLTVTASGDSHGLPVRVVLARYVPAGRER
jgi:type II secretory pathway pseudopilin PulG